MNEKIKQTIDDFANFTPKHIDAPTHCTDKNRVFDIAIAAFEAQESLSDVYAELRTQIQEHHFPHEQELLTSVKHDITLIVEFLKYQQNK